MSAKPIRYSPIVVGVIAAALVLVGLSVPPWVFPPIQSQETGPAAIEMVQFKDPDRQLPYSLKPKPLEPADNAGSPKASEVYKNVKVLGNLTDAEFTRLMLAITEWVAPKQGCEYCHDLSSDEGFASDARYTKVVARRMLQMVRHINSKWPQHVAPSGVTCYTCHRGQNVPPWTWYEQNHAGDDQFMGKPRPWHLKAKTIRQFFPDVPYDKYLMEQHASARIQSTTPLVGEGGRPGVVEEQDAEDLYLFMMQTANSLGVNCTYCHNSRAFRDWSQSTPYRWIAYWGIRMARDINSNYIEPLKTVFPAVRKGPLGDPAKAHCGTCHLGNNKPLGGYKLLDHYLVGLTEDGKAPDPGPKEAILLGNAKPTAETGPDQNALQPKPVAAPVSKDAIGQSVAPGENGQGTTYKSEEKPTQGESGTLGGTVAPVPQDKNTMAPSPPPTGEEAPQGSSPDEMSPNSPPAPTNGTRGTADAPSTGIPPSNPLPKPKGETGGAGSGASTGSAPQSIPAPKGPAQGTTTRYN
ncbi:photosynthetic reaction center cytochrome c subunit [Jiella sp. MQZ9-1]|uniref:Photosynthetic reaction center cytochrome c subunit n=1 Tax=Jiella flava TaxID=2816857 RepID=A0A939FUF6_9HYPH|nr:photosynthetic reaction center cytochrome PufC [Jiella flava]MBO0661737.1 photosynthetic reaction center cytochrome c subunit [Jiella flava]MCD2470378.1 photosynthetic reaction center cytochrome c subunit [Jiella flava]